MMEQEARGLDRRKAEEKNIQPITVLPLRHRSCIFKLFQHNSLFLKDEPLLEDIGDQLEAEHLSLVMLA